MSGLFLDGIDAPQTIKTCLKALSSRFIIESENTKAANGYVYLGKNRITNQPIVIKFYYWGGQQQYHAEPQQLADLNSPHILSILDAGLADLQWAYFVTPLYAHGDLDEALAQGPLGNLDCIDKATDVLNGASHLHSARLLHRDLKLSNIFVTDDRRALIGDFGSVKKIPEGFQSIPPSGHSLIYRPPETITANSYGLTGDIYQIGLIFYQLLGGALPYDGYSWLSRRQQEELDRQATESDRSQFIDSCIRAKIVAGSATDLSTLPPWVPSHLKRILRKACSVDPNNRFRCASDFAAKLHQLRPRTLDWALEDGIPTLRGALSFRITQASSEFITEKKRGALWRRDNSIPVTSLRAAVEAIEAKV